jgi:MFS family permease
MPVGRERPVFEDSRKSMTRRMPIYYGWVVVGTIAAVLTATSGARFLYGVALKPVSEQYGWERAALTVAVMINMIALSLIQPLIGLLVDRIGSRRILVGGTILVAAMLLPLSYANQLWQVYVVYGLIGAVGFAATSPVNTTALVNRWFSRRRGAALSIATSGSAFGQLLVVPLATWTMTMTSWQTTYRILAAVLLLGMAPLGFLLLRDGPEERDFVDEEPVPVGVASQVAGATLREALHSSAFWLLAYGFLTCGFTMAFANTHFMAFADDMGMAAMTAADVVATTAIFSIIGTIALGVAADRYRRPPILALTYALRGTAFLLLLLLPIGHPTFIYAVVLGISWTATTPLTAAISGDLYGPANLGLIFGTMFTFMNLGTGIGAYFDGLIHDFSGGYEIALFVNGGMGILAAAAALAVDGKVRFGSRPLPEQPQVAASGT